MTEEYTLASFDGTELYGKTDALDDPCGVVVIVHGLCEHQGRYDYLTARLNAQGYSVYRFDHRGHGRSKGQKVYYADRTDIVKDTDFFVERAIAENPDLPIFMLGHSMGGFGAASYGTTFPGKLNGYVLSGAWTRDNSKLAATVAEGDGDDMDYLPNELGDGVCSDPSVGRVYVADPLVIMEMSVALFRACHAGHIWLKENAATFTDPVMILHGADDGLVSPKDSLEFFEQIGSSDKSLRIYAGMMHEIFNEYDKDLVVDDAIGWLNAHVAL